MDRFKIIMKNEFFTLVKGKNELVNIYFFN